MSKAKKPAKSRPAREWRFIMSNGEQLAVLTYCRDEIAALFPDAKIKGDRVLL